MQEYKALPLGRDDFRKVIENGNYYVDKTMLIAFYRKNCSIAVCKCKA